MADKKKPVEEIIKEAKEENKWNMGCSYGVHDMEYTKDEAGNIINSKCKLCGAVYSGFHF